MVKTDIKTVFDQLEYSDRKLILRDGKEILFYGSGDIFKISHAPKLMIFFFSILIKTLPYGKRLHSNKVYAILTGI